MVDDLGQCHRPRFMKELVGQFFIDASCCSSEGRAPELPTAGCSWAGCSTVADPQLYEPKCLSRNRSEEVVCDKKIICQNCNNKEGLVGSLMA